MTTQFPAQLKTALGNWSLPLFMNQNNKYPMGFLLFAIAVVLYLPANHIHFFTSQLLPMSWIDTLVPFAPNTVWIYISEYIFFPVVYYTCKDLINLNRYFYSFLVLQVISVFIFWIWPTTYLREAFPLPDDLNKIT